MFWLKQNRLRKSQGLSLNLIVLAAIALIALIVMVAIFWGKVRLFTKSTEYCEERGGKCVNKGDCPYGKTSLKCPEGMECCMAVTCESMGGQCVVGKSCPEGTSKVFLAKCNKGMVCCK